MQHVTESTSDTVIAECSYLVNPFFLYELVASVDGLSNICTYITAFIFIFVVVENSSLHFDLLSCCSPHNHAPTQLLNAEP